MCVELFCWSGGVFFVVGAFFKPKERTKCCLAPAIAAQTPQSRCSGLQGVIYCRAPEIKHLLQSPLAALQIVSQACVVAAAGKCLSGCSPLVPFRGYLSSAFSLCFISASSGTALSLALGFGLCTLLLCFIQGEFS